MLNPFIEIDRLSSSDDESIKISSSSPPPPLRKARCSISTNQAIDEVELDETSSSPFSIPHTKKPCIRGLKTGTWIGSPHPTYDRYNLLNRCSTGCRDQQPALPTHLWPRRRDRNVHCRHPLTRIATWQRTPGRRKSPTF